MGTVLRTWLDHRAALDAAAFCDEYPGEVLEHGWDWDAEAWAIACRDIDGAAARGQRLGNAVAGHDIAWAYYAEALRAGVNARWLLWDRGVEVATKRLTEGLVAALAAEFLRGRP